MKIVFTNGCFDILHVGHVKLLEYCHNLAQQDGSGLVIVGLNTDESIKRIKGINRPYNCESDRVAVLSALKYVDHVQLFDEDTPYNILSKIKPDVIVKGGDYNTKDIIGSNFAKEVKIFNFISGYSTTNTINKINEDMLD